MSDIIKLVKLALKPEKEGAVVGEDRLVILDDQDTVQITIDGVPTTVRKIKLKKVSEVISGGVGVFEVAGEIIRPKSAYQDKGFVIGSDNLQVESDKNKIGFIRGSGAFMRGRNCEPGAPLSAAEGKDAVARNYAASAHASGMLGLNGDAQYERVVLKSEGLIEGQTPGAEITFLLLPEEEVFIVIPEKSAVMFRLDIVTYAHEYWAYNEEEYCGRAGYVRGFMVAGICWREGAGKVHIAEEGGSGTFENGTVIQHTFGYGRSRASESPPIIEPNIPEGDTGSVYLPIRMKGICDLSGSLKYRVSATLHMTVLGIFDQDPGKYFGICDATADANGDGVCSCRDV